MTDFEYIFGSRPTGPRDWAMKEKQRKYDFEKSRFEGIVEQDWPAEVLAKYAEWGIGMPAAYKRNVGADPHMQPVVVAFPQAMYAKPRYIPLSTALKFPGTIWRRWVMQSLAEGWEIPDIGTILPGFPGGAADEG